MDLDLPGVGPFAEMFRQAFTRPTFERFVTLLTGVILTIGRRTVSRSMRVMRPALRGHWTNYHRFFSHASYSLDELGRILATAVLALVPAGEPVVLAADDTVDGKTGSSVWAKGPHRDGRRSSRAHAAIKWGHKWMVLCVVVKLPGIGRPWALPVMAGLCLTEKVARRVRCAPATPSYLCQALLMRLMRWFPHRRFILLADARAASHRLACFAARHRGRVTLVSRLRSDANLYARPRRKGARKGRKIACPAEAAVSLASVRRNLAWYGSSRREADLVTDTGLWYSVHDVAAVPIRWVCVKAERGLKDAYFYTTDENLDAGRVVELYALRWNIEVTFEECRALLGLETTRHFCRRSVGRVVPMLLGAFTAVALIWNQMVTAAGTAAGEMLSQTPCYQKQSMTFADVLYQVRREIWAKGLLQHQGCGGRESWLNSLPDLLRQTLLNELASAA